MAIKEACATCKEFYLTSIMMSCLGCGENVCIDCAINEAETMLFIETSGKGEIFTSKDKDMSGPSGWVCSKCFKGQFGRNPKRLQWTDESHSCGEKRGSTTGKNRSKN